MLNCKIINGTLIDGTGKERFKADIGISGDRISEIGSLKDAPAEKVIDAEGMFVCPGFIDFHTHSDLSVIYDRYARSRIYSGVTTDVTGSCGIGVAPANDRHRELLEDYLSTQIVGVIPKKIELKWNSFKDYLDYIDERPPAINTAHMLAHGPIRLNEMGFVRGNADENQLKNMKNEVKRAMEEGAFGFTIGLIYLPGTYTSTEELVELVKEIAPYNGIYCSHIRNQGDSIDKALDEAVYIAKAAGVPLQVSHLKIMGAQNFGKMKKIIQRLENEEKNGLEVYFDVYPYLCGMTSLTAFMPPWSFEGGVEALIGRLKAADTRAKILSDLITGIKGWQNIYKDCGGWKGVHISSVMTEKNKWTEGKSIEEAAKIKGMDVFEFVFDILIEENGKVQIIEDIMSEEDVDRVIAHPHAMIGSDSMSLSEEGLLSKGKTHPRAFGTTGRMFAHYVREKGLLTYEEAVRKMTGLPAWRLGLSERGVLKKGNFADITVFDPENIKDNATYAEPVHYTTGVEYVLVNGETALEKGKQTNALAGRVLRNKAGK